MKFNSHLSPEVKEVLTTQYKEHIKKTSMTQKEMRALREWVKDGHSVYENPDGAWADGQVPIEFLRVYRDDEDIRQYRKGMNPEETRKFAMDYYGWSDDEPIYQENCVEQSFELASIATEELPFQ